MIEVHRSLQYKFLFAQNVPAPGLDGTQRIREAIDYDTLVKTSNRVEVAY